ncbi:3-phosphoshikimate 1-carboxyvinyltransferase [Gammaproteobacteria bacterium]
MRLMAGLLAGQTFDSVLVGDTSLSCRPMRRVIEPLTLMGAMIEASPAGTAPLRIHGERCLYGIDYPLSVASAQVKSALLLAGLYAAGRTTITEPAPSRDHTELMLAGFGYTVERQGAQVALTGGGLLRATEIEIPADLSSAAFFLVGAAITPGSDLILEHVGVNPTRTGILSILSAMGANLEVMNERMVGGEPVADLRVRYAPLHGIAIPPEWVPLAIDEFPALFVAAACAEGETLLTDAEELRVKESDRIQTMADGLHTLGIDATPTPDGIVIRGGQFESGEINSHGDHRIAMAFAMAALRAQGTLHILDCANVDTSFPNFAELARSVGLNITVTHVE